MGKRIGLNIFFSWFIINKCGVAILTPPNIDFKVIDTIRDNEGRFLKISIEINDTLFISSTFMHQQKITNQNKTNSLNLEFLLHHPLN